MPPAAMMMSVPSMVRIGQEVPNGPRTPTRSPIFRRLSARVTLPTKRMVWPKLSRWYGSEEMEMAASPYPGT